MFKTLSFWITFSSQLPSFQVEREILLPFWERVAFSWPNRCPSPKRALFILSESSVTETVHYSPTMDSELADIIAKAGREVKNQTSHESQPPQFWLEGNQSQWEETRLPVLTPSSWFRAHRAFFGLNKGHSPILPRAPKTFLGSGPGHGPTAQ